MQVVDHSPAKWFLLHDGTDYILDVNSGRGGIGYSITVRLSEEECQEYRLRGCDYINDLAERLAYIVNADNGRYIRSVQTAAAIHQAVTEWRGGQP